ncbi:unnamed protein product [Pleuronectes platessa]|uniref:Uncharacterized protein n=1 Tax=Pleuronectes platessa TaxID=8262 RepID=A0A9N7TQV1_PLEPL|nr:unnamed protein product [Pleuronectes platessa]
MLISKATGGSRAPPLFRHLEKWPKKGKVEEEELGKGAAEEEVVKKKKKRKHQRLLAVCEQTRLHSYLRTQPDA